MRRTKDLFLIYGGAELQVRGFTDASFQYDKDDCKSQSSYIFTLNGGAVSWKIADPLTKPLSQKKHDSHVFSYGLKNKHNWM